LLENGPAADEPNTRDQALHDAGLTHGFTTEYANADEHKSARADRDGVKGPDACAAIVALSIPAHREGIGVGRGQVEAAGRNLPQCGGLEGYEGPQVAHEMNRR